MIATPRIINRSRVLEVLQTHNSVRYGVLPAAQVNGKNNILYHLNTALVYDRDALDIEKWDKIRCFAVISRNTYIAVVILIVVGKYNSNTISELMDPETRYIGFLA